MISLRKIEPQDLPFLYQWENDASAWADGGNHNPLSREDLKQYIESTTGDIYKDGQLRLIVEQKTEQGTMTVGAVDLYDFDPRNLRAGVGIYIAPNRRRCGCASEALKQLQEYAFGFLGLNLLYAFVSETNLPSQCLFKRAGYTPSSAIPCWTREGSAAVWWKTKTE